MRHSIKRISKSALSVILALMMIVSTMAVGIVTVGAIDPVADGYYRVLFTKSSSLTGSFSTVKLNYNDGNGNWSNPSATQIGQYNSNYVYYLDVPSSINNSTKIEVNDGSTWKEVTSTAKGNIKDGYIFKISSSGSVSCENPKVVENFTVSSDTVETGSSVTLSASYTSVITSNVTYTYTDQDDNVLLSTTSSSGTWTPSTSGTYTITCKATDGYITKTSSTTKTVTVSDPGAPSAVTGDLLSVLKGEKVMFYYGDLWNSSTKYIRTTSSTTSTLDSGSDTKRTITKNSTSYSYYSRSVTADSSKYYISNSSSWSGVQMNENAVAGKAYVLNNNSTFSGSSSNNVVSFSAGTTTVTTTADSAIQNGSKLSVSTSDAGSSVVGVKNSVKYYITSDNSAYSEYTLTDGKLDTSSLTDGTYTLKSVLTDGTIYVVGDTDTFTVSSKTDLAKPNYSVSNSNVVTSKANATITVTSSGDPYPPGTTYTLLDASDNVVSGVTWNDNVATVKFADLSSAEANYKVKVSAGETTYNPAVSDEFKLKKVQLYAVTLEANADAEVTGTYTDAYGESGKTIAEGDTADVPSGNTVHVNATVTDTANKTFNKFTYNGNNFANNADITITADGTISTVIDTVSYRTVKIAVISYADPDNHTSTTDGEYLTSKNVTYTFGGSTKTATMTAVAEDPTAYFAISGKWDGKGHKFYIYEIQVPSTVTSINVDGKKSITLDDTSEYYAIYHFSSAWNVSTFSTSDRYYYVNVVANTDVDSGATVSATGSASVKYNQDTSRTLYKYQSTIELTATPSNATAFSYDHWSDGTSNIDSPYTVVGDATLTAFFKANQTYAINLVNTDANLASITSSPATSTYAGNTVKVTVTAKTGYECTGITVKTATNVDVDVTNNADGTYSFTMPAEVVTVTPTITAKTLVNVTVKANDSSLGTVTVQSGNIYVGENFTVTATANSDSTFSSWTAVGADQVSTSTTDRVTTATFKATAQSVTITANFNTYVYSVITNSGEIEMTPSVADSNVFYSTDTVAKDAIFRIKRTFGSEVKYSVNSANSSTTWWFNNLSMEDVIPSWDGSDSVALNAGNYKNATGSAYYVKFDASTGTVSLSESTVGGTTVKVKAMNGVSTLSDLGTTVAEAANTSSSVVKEEVNLSGGTQYKVTKGSTVKVTTTMLADTEAAEKFVYAYVVNNKDTYLATEGIAVTRAEDKKYATYSAQFTIDEDTTESIFTVYPIYYYKACAKDGEYIKFYVDKSDAKNWGDNLYNYAYYYKTAGDTEDVYRSDGTWPGQPMLYDETKQLYYSLVPKQIGGKPVSGLTVNIGSDQLQSFDFDDFKVINEIGYDIVRLDLKQRSGHTQNKVTLFGAADATAYDKDKKTFSTPTYTYTNLVSDFNGRWEEYKDINGNDVSLLGKAVNADNTNTTYIVSSATHDSERGQWMSAFSVYKVDKDGNVTYITTDFPSEFIPRIVQDGQTEATANTSAYNAILNAGLGDAPVKIVYEDQVSTRIDGRWYYAQSDSEVCAYAYYRTYETTDCSGTPSALLINKDYSKIIAETELINDDGIVIGGKNSTLGKEISVVSSPLAGYIFDHWSVADKDGNIIINKLDNVGSSFTTTLDQEMHYVANFRKATQGQLVISHSKYTGSDAKNGLGYYRLEVQVKKSDGTWSTVYAGSGTGANGQSVTIADLAETDQIIRIKLITETAGENTFRYWYTTSSDGTEIIEDPDGDMTWNGTATSEPTGKNGILTYTFDTEVWKLFSGRKQIVTQLNFYSDIAPMNKNYKLTYKYTDRFGKEKIYVVKGTHDDAYYVKNNNSWAPSDQLITDNAPPIDDLYKNCTWIIANSNKDGTDATLVAVQNGKTYKVDIYDASGASESFTYPINSYVINKQTGQFFVADEYIMVGETKNYFSYWAVYKRVEKDGKVTQGAEVARHFYREYTLVVLDDYIIKPVYGAERKDQVYISAPQYTREKYSNEDGTVVKDSLYVDFMVAYMSAAGDLIRNDASGEKYKTGLIIEIGQNKVLGTNEDSSVNTDYSGITYDSNLDTVKSAANNLTGSPTRYSFATGDNRKLYNFRATNTNYNNMNRLDYAVPFTNTENNRMYVMKAYYYVIIDGEIVLSNPVYFNLYEIGTSDPITE